MFIVQTVSRFFGFYQNISSSSKVIVLVCHCHYRSIMSTPVSCNDPHCACPACPQQPVVSSERCWAPACSCVQCNDCRDCLQETCDTCNGGNDSVENKENSVENNINSREIVQKHIKGPKAARRLFVAPHSPSGCKSPRLRPVTRDESRRTNPPRQARGRGWKGLKKQD